LLGNQKYKLCIGHCYHHKLHKICLSLSG
jgi:hypothetical protein